MLEYSQVNTAITEAGPLDDEILAIARIADDRWIFQFEPIVIEAEYAPEIGRLMLSGSLGYLSSDQRLEHLEKMLAYATLWRETGGLRIGLSPDSDELELMMDLEDLQINPQTLAIAAKNLAIRCLSWTALLSVPVTQPEESNLNPAVELIKI